MLIISALTLSLLLINFIIAPTYYYYFKVYGYECGFNVIHGQTRSTFHIHFYIIAILFLLFDLEIILLLPIAITLKFTGYYAVIITCLFLAIITLGFILELGYNTLSFVNH